jgi:hypothetical protein
MSEEPTSLKDIGVTPRQGSRSVQGRAIKEDISYLVDARKFKQIYKEGGYHKRGYLTTDGHIVDSIPEAIFDNFLHEWNIHHQIQQEYPFVGLSSINKKPVADFKIDDTYIEIACFDMIAPNSMLSNIYRDKINYKQKLCKEKNIPLIVINYEDFNNLFTKCGELILKQKTGAMNTDIHSANFKYIMDKLHTLEERVTQLERNQTINTEAQLALLGQHAEEP